MKLTVITGDSGTGKTAALKAANRFGQRTVTLDEMLRQIPGYEYGDNLAISLLGDWEVEHVNMNEEGL